MVRVKAPGVVKLFGEHAVVYGKPAIAMAIDRFITVEAVKISGGDVEIISRDLGVRGIYLRIIDGSVAEAKILDNAYAAKLASYAYRAVEVTRRFLGVRDGVRLTITSELPVGAGLATSAAVAASTVAAYSRELGFELRKEEVAKLAHQVEVEVQGAASPMDTTTSTMGGLLYIKPGVEVRRIAAKLPIVVGVVERESTTGDLVARVRKLYGRHPGVISRIMDTIELLVNEALDALARQDLELVGELMNVNQGLLEALGVSNRRLMELIYGAREAGALGAKISGAGGGGAVVALAPGVEDSVIRAFKAHGGVGFRANVWEEGLTYIQ